MNKEEIVKKLKNNWCRPGEGWREFERAKRIICPDDEVINGYERDFRIKITVDYLKV